MDAAQLARQGLPLAVQKQLLSRITPLSSANTGLPKQASLRHWWLEVEDAIEGISSVMSPTALCSVGV